MYEIILTEAADRDFDLHTFAGNKILLKKIKRLLAELEQHPRSGTGKPKMLSHDMSGMWSRRIDDKHRMVYSIEDETVTVFVLSLRDHYDDK